MSLRGFIAHFLCLALAVWASAVHGAVTFRGAENASMTPGITHIGAGTVDTRNSCGDITPSIPAGNTGDILIAVVNARENSAGVSMSGWNLYFSDTYPGLGGTSAEMQVFIYWRLATGGDPNTVNQSGTCDSIGARISRFRGVNQSSPFETNPIGSGQWVRQNANHIDTGTVTTTSATAMAIVIAAVNDNNTVTAGAGWSQSFDSGLNLDRDMGISLHYQAQTTAGAKSVSNWFMSATDENYGIILALTPASGSLTISKPTGTSQGDVMLASIAVRNSAATIAAPAGWTLIRQTAQGSGDSLRLATYYRLVGASEGANYTWSFSGGSISGAVGGITTYSGVNTTTPIDAEAGGATASSTSHIAPTVTTTLADGMLVTTHAFASSATWTPPTGMTEAVDIASAAASTAGVAMEINWQERPASGATGARTAIASGNADAGATQSVALRPAALMCYSDNFDRANGSPGTGWIVSNSGGTFGNPVIANNRLRLTDASGNVATMATLQRLFPGAGNRIEVEFDHYAYGGSGADGIVLVLSDNAVTPAPGGYGGSLGYAQLTTTTPDRPGFAGGWLGVGIDEYGNFPNPTEGRNGGPGFVVDSVTIRGSGSGTTGYPFHANSGGLAPGIDGNGAASPPHRYRVIVDHTNGVNAYVSVERDTGSGYQMLIAPYDAKAQAGQAAVPATWILSYTGSTGGSTNIHEIDNLEICATAQQAVSTVNHYQILHSGTGVNCQAENVTIIAKDSANAATSSNGVSIQVDARRVAGTPAGNRGDWVLISGSGALNNGTADDGRAIYTFGASETTVVLGLKNTHLQTVNIDVVDGNGITEASGTGNTDAPNDQNLQFVNSAFRISNAAGNAAAIPTQTAGVSSATHYLQAIRTDTNTGACVAAFPPNTSVNVEMAFRCNNPIACQSGKQVEITSNAVTTAIAANPNSGVTTYQSTLLRFGANALAPFTLVYPDVGQLTLHARYNIPLPNNSPSGNYMLGSSNPFVVKPYDFVLTNIQRTADGVANPGATSAGGPVFMAAGQDFSATVTAVNAQGQPTPNYGKEVVAEGVRLTSNLVSGLNLSANPAVTNLSAFGTFNNGSATGTTFSWSEVGIITLTPEVADQDYLGAGNAVGTVSGNVGRFRPFDFNVSYNTPVFNTFCGTSPNGFTYIGQNFTYQTVPVITVTARNAQGGATTNYGATGGWFKITNSTLTGKAYSALTGAIDTGLVALLPADPVIANSGGATSTLTFGDGGGLRFVRTADPTSPNSPFNAEISLAINVLDSDGVSFAGNLARFGAATAGNGIAFTQGKQMRFGRLRIMNALGTEQLPLPVEMRLEYWSGGAFITNLQDSCTSLTMVPAGSARVTLGNFQGGLPSGSTSFPAADISFANGIARPNLSAPGASGSVDVTGNLAAPLTHLRGKWNDATNGAGYDDDPVGRAVFGIYGPDKRPPRVIYSRENY